MPPIYIVQDNSTEKPTKHLVDARTSQQALAAVTAPRFTAKIAETSELIALTKAGVEVVEANGGK